jgi:hypothetical protein
MSSENLYSISAKITVVTVTIPAAASHLLDLIGTPPTGKNTSDLLQATVLGAVTAGTTRDAFLFGGSDALGYVAAGVEKVLPVRGDVFLKRAGASDVTAQVELAWA